jgi:hypothetical protein
MSTLAALTDAYLVGPCRLRQALAGMSPGQVRARPVAGKWSTLEVVCHLADFEPVYADRMKRVIAEDRPTLTPANSDRFHAALAYDHRDLEEELGLIEGTRGQLARILRTLPDEALGRVGVHTERGPHTLGQLLEIITEHIPHHLQFVAQKRAALGLSP